jgi:hypothetical protein
MSSKTYRILLICFFLAASGCAHQRENSIVRWWADYNTLKHPALFFELIDHKPYRSVRVGSSRWMYNQNPGHQYTLLQAQAQKQDVRSTSRPYIDSEPPIPTPASPAVPSPMANPIDKRPIPETKKDFPQKPAAPMRPSVPPLPGKPQGLPVDDSIAGNSEFLLSGFGEPIRASSGSDRPPKEAVHTQKPNRAARIAHDLFPPLQIHPPLRRGD